MREREIVQRLALERCRMNISHLCALYVLTDDGDGQGDHKPSLYYHGLFESLNKDLELIEELFSTE